MILMGNLRNLLLSTYLGGKRALLVCLNCNLYIFDFLISEKEGKLKLTTLQKIINKSKHVQKEHTKFCSNDFIMGSNINEK